MDKKTDDSRQNEKLLKRTMRLTMDGAAMSAFNVTLGHPLDTVKTYAQKQNQDFYHAARNVFGHGSSYNGMQNLYKGLTPNITRQIVNTTWRVPLTTLAPQAFADTFSMTDENGKPTQKANIAASFLVTGPVDVTLSNGFELAKVTKQTGGTYGKIYESFKEKGGTPKAFCSTFMKGSVPSYWKSAVGYSALFIVHKIDNDINKKLTPESASSSNNTTPISAAAASVIKVSITNPLDVIKTRKQSLGSDEGVSMASTASKILREEGVKAFYRGMAPRVFHGYLTAFAGMHIMKLSNKYSQQDGTDFNASHAQSILEKRTESEQNQNISR
ncbi:MAG: hypothetical protein COV35_06880 [Alphaproteobacteria bacterium CG11_big_fil_rev_8_21_14_0_20_39_49]|nr:MAG: hypothetical protein COV35_06880 [Alphaproteobacteria bacterium CG11_big_fil_rev_8_21_14_0_20_39_49]